MRYGDSELLFDAGRATVLRLAEAGSSPTSLTALFVTHAYSDHVCSVPDLALSRWALSQVHAAGPLVIVAPAGPAVRVVEGMLNIYRDDIASRMAHVNRNPPEVDLRTLEATYLARQVWSSDDGSVTADAVLVHHEPVVGAVAYRVRSAGGVVVISGDTVALGASAQRAGVKHLVLTHLIPSPPEGKDGSAFEEDARRGGYCGKVTVGSNLARIEVGGS